MENIVPIKNPRCSLLQDIVKELNIPKILPKITYNYSLVWVDISFYVHQKSNVIKTMG